MLLPDLGRDPRGQRIVREGVSVGRRSAVRRVDIPVVQMEEPVVVRRVLVHPLHHQRRDLLRRLRTALPGVVDFIEARVELPRGMALSKRTDHGRVEADDLHFSRQAFIFDAVPEAPVAPLDKQVRRRASVSDHPAVNTEHAGVQGRPRGQTGRVAGVAVGETNPFRREGVDLRRGVAVIAITAQMVGTQRVNINVENTHVEAGIEGFLRWWIRVVSRKKKKPRRRRGPRDIGQRDGQAAHCAGPRCC